MQVTHDTKTGDSFTRFDDGSSIETRQWYAEDPFAGHLQDGETETFDDGVTVTRQGNRVKWVEPSDWKERAARAA